MEGENICSFGHAQFQSEDVAEVCMEDDKDLNQGRAVKVEGPDAFQRRVTDVRWGGRQTGEPNMRSQLSTTVLLAGKEMKMDWEALGNLGTILRGQQRQKNVRTGARERRATA